MKGLIVRQTVVEGVMDWAHGGGHGIYRIVIPEAGNLCVTFDQGKMLYAFTGFELDEAETVREIEVPDSLVNRLREYTAARKRVEDVRTEFEALLPQPTGPKFKIGDRVRLAENCTWRQMEKRFADGIFMVEQVYTSDMHTPWDPNPAHSYAVRLESDPPLRAMRIVDAQDGTEREEQVPTGIHVDENGLEPLAQ